MIRVETAIECYKVMRQIPCNDSGRALSLSMILKDLETFITEEQNKSEEVPADNEPTEEATPEE